jgi:hypothetical protein
VRTITDPDNPVPLLISDTIIFVDTSRNDSATLVLPSAVGSAGRYFMIKVRSGKKSQVSVVAPSRQMIDGGGSPVTLRLGQTVTIVSDGAGWNTVMGPE